MSRTLLHWPMRRVGLHAHVVAIEPILLIDVGVHHSDIAGPALRQPLQQGGVLVADAAPPASAIPVERALDPVPGLVVHNAIMLTFINLPTVVDFADVDHIGEQVVKAILGDRLAARLSACPRRSGLHPPSAPVEFLHHRDQRSEFEVEREDLPYPLSFLLIH